MMYLALKDLAEFAKKLTLPLHSAPPAEPPA